MNAINTAGIRWEEENRKVSYVLQTPYPASPDEVDLFADSSIRFGQFAAVRRNPDGSFDAFRDPTGNGKLFYTFSEGAFYFSGEYSDLFKYGSTIYSLPKGSHVRLHPDGKRQLIRRIDAEELTGPIHSYTGDGESFIGSPAGEFFRKTVNARLESVFAHIRSMEDSGYTVFIALSGGLDSSIMASLAHKTLARAVAFTLDLGRSEDAEKSALIAKELGIGHTIFQTSKEEILDAVKEAPLLCQDYRDFNVHCAALNILLARNIIAYAKQHGIDTGKIAVITGDLMNEFTCDYHEEVIGTTRYYRLPRVDTKQLQAHLIGGLDTSDREILVFGRYGIQCIQPYAAVYDLYAAIPKQVLELTDPKKILNSFLIAPQILEYLPKSKLRAQVGSKESMGVLGLCHAMNIGEKDFLEAILKPAGAFKEQIPIFMGRYQTEEFK